MCVCVCVSGGASERASCVCMHGRVIAIIDIYIVWHPVTFHL